MAVYNPVKRTAMYYAQISLGAVMEETDGWQQAVRFGPADNELELLRTSAGVHDISPQGQVRVIGADAPNIIRKLTPGGSELAVGFIKRAEMGTQSSSQSIKIARLTHDEFAVITATGQAASMVELLEGVPADCAHLLDLSSSLAGVAITGPCSIEILSAITELDVSSKAMPNLACAQSRFADIYGLLLRYDIAGLPSYQIYVTREFGEYFWKAVIEAAHVIGAGPVGVEGVSALTS